MRCAVGAAMLLLFNGAAFGGNTSGLISHYFTYQPPGSPGLFFVHISATAANAPACATQTMNYNRWVTRVDTAAGKAHMALLMTAKLTGKPVSIQGKGGTGYANPCEDWGDTEGIHTVVFN